MEPAARKKILAKWEVTELVDKDFAQSKKIELRIDGKSFNYFVCIKMVPSPDARRNRMPIWIPNCYHLYPVVLHRSGAPWPEANLWIQSSAQAKSDPNMDTLSNTADDMAAFLRYIDDAHLDWMHFPSQKLHRPTYRFNAYLKSLIQCKELSLSTAKRRMGTVVRFYRWLMIENLFSPEHPPWKESDTYVGFRGYYGETNVKIVKSTDVAIRSTSQIDLYNERVSDGGNLRPLSQLEQQWLWEALAVCRNTEMSLIHAFAILTGARMQTILTFRLQDVLQNLQPTVDGIIRFPVGAGTGVDTKYDKKLVIHIPAWFYEKLKIYGLSPRAKKRRLKAIGGDVTSQYLFLSAQGSPLYSARSDHTHADQKGRAYRQEGQSVRQFIRDYIVPIIREKHDQKFNFRFHDLRATYGMNLVDDRLKLVEEKKATLSQVMHFVQARMGHASLTTTELYLNFRSRLQLVRAVQDGWEESLQKMAQRAMEDSDA